MTISDGKSTEVPTEAPPAEEEPQSQPLLYVERYTVSPVTVEAGQEFTVTACIRNTSESQSVRNMAIQAATDSDQLTLLEDSSTTYWERLGADTTQELTLRYRAETAILVGKYHIQLSMTFDNEDAREADWDAREERRNLYLGAGAAILLCGFLVFGYQESLERQQEAPARQALENQGIPRWRLRTVARIRWILLMAAGGVLGAAAAWLVYF